MLQFRFAQYTGNAETEDKLKSRDAEAKHFIFHLPAGMDEMVDFCDPSPFSLAPKEDLAHFELEAKEQPELEPAKST